MPGNRHFDPVGWGKAARKVGRDMNSLDEIWAGVLELMGQELTSVAINTWFGDCRPVGFSEAGLTLCVPSEFKRSIIFARFMEPLKAALSQIFSGNMEVTLVGEESAREQETKKTGEADSEEYTFERFVVGPSNKFAHAASLAVAKGETRSYNPLFIYGDSGLGKTHLLYAIRHEVMLRHPEYYVVFVRGEDFMNELIAAIQTGKNVDFREKYRSADFLLIDDIQIVAGKASTQDEMFHTFNTLYEAKKQMVFTSDRPPSDMPNLTERLQSRLGMGLQADIQPPDFETRAAIVRNKSMSLGLALSSEVVNYIAENMTSNVRQLEGAVLKIRAQSDLMNVQLTVSEVAKLLKDMFRQKSAYVPTPEDIIRETAKYYSLSPEDLKGQRRTRNTALARQIAMYEIRKLTNLSLQDIGAIFEGRDHTTVLSSIQKIEKNMEADSEFAQQVKDITSNINAHNL